MEDIKSTATVIGVLVSIFGLVKSLLELSTIFTSRQRAYYEYVHTLAQRANDPLLVRYAIELGYKSLVNDARLTTSQRILILSLPNRITTVQQYLKVRGLLTVQQTGKILQWKYSRHTHRWYRNLLMIGLTGIYLALTPIGTYSIIGFSISGIPALLGQLLSLPPTIAIYALFSGAAALYHALKISIASQLVHEASFHGPILD